MSRMLTFTQDGWTVAKRFARDGRRAEALQHLLRLLACPDLPVGTAIEARRLAAEIEIERERFGAARRHLRAALALAPSDAEVCYLVGRSFEDDPEGSDERALRWYRKALSLDVANALLAAAVGRAAIRCNRIRVGTSQLDQAVQDAPGDLTVISMAIDGYLEAGAIEEAERTLMRARFRCQATKELDRLDQRVRFESARRVQRRAQDALVAREGELRSLPFLRVVGGSIRRDAASRPMPHLRRLRFDRG